MADRGRARTAKDRGSEQVAQIAGHIRRKPFILFQKSPG